MILTKHVQSTASKEQWTCWTTYGDSGCTVRLLASETHFQHNHSIEVIDVWIVEQVWIWLNLIKDIQKRMTKYLKLKGFSLLWQNTRRKAITYRKYTIMNSEMMVIMKCITIIILHTSYKPKVLREREIKQI